MGSNEKPTELLVQPNHLKSELGRAGFYFKGNK
jgi:hypothetical protein